MESAYSLVSSSSAAQSILRVMIILYKDFVESILLSHESCLYIMAVFLENVKMHKPMDVGVPVSPGGEEMLAASAAMDERDDDLLDDDDALDDDDDDDTLNLSDDDDDDDADDGKFKIKLLSYSYQDILTVQF